MTLHQPSTLARDGTPPRNAPASRPTGVPDAGATSCMAVPRATQPPGVLPSSDVGPSCCEACGQRLHYMTTGTLCVACRAPVAPVNPGRRYVAERVDEHRTRPDMQTGNMGKPRGACGSCGTPVWLSQHAKGLPVLCWGCRIAEDAEHDARCPRCSSLPLYDREPEDESCWTCGWEPAK
jgi:hypothetical protein